MISVVDALQDYREEKNLISLWHKKVDNFIYSQQYSVEDYSVLCYELQNVWPNIYTISRQNFLTDVTVKHVPFTEREVYYAMCTMPNYSKISSNVQTFVAPTIDSVMMFKDSDRLEMPAVAFFDNKDDIRKYYRDIVRPGEIVFAVMASYFSVFEDVTVLNIRKFKKISANSRVLTNSYFSYSNISQTMSIKQLAYTVSQDELPDSSISVILLDCLAHFNACSKFIGRSR